MFRNSINAVKMDPGELYRHFGIFTLFGYIFVTISDAGGPDKYMRQQDKSFPSWTWLLGRNVTCGNHKPGVFPSRTWSCTDIKIDGFRMTFTYMPGLGGSKRECGETKGKNDLAALCNRLLFAQGIKETLWSAFVSQASCHLSQGRRILLSQNISKKHVWVMEDQGKGYIKSIQCMVIS